jgi:transcriptional regulator of acetoin/glycerol metabolism
MKNVNIKLDKELAFIPALLKVHGFTGFTVTDSKPALFITGLMPVESLLFIVIWDKHDVKKIEQFGREKHKYLRGFFIKDEVKKDPSRLIAMLKDIFHEISFADGLRESAENIKKKNEFIEIGSFVDLGTAKDQLDDLFSARRFISLYIDTPMIRMMSKLTTILDDMKPHMEKLQNHYKELIEKIKKTGGLDVKNNFDRVFIKKLLDKKQSTPVTLEPILLTGATGTGKTLIARWIYKHTQLNGSFQEINSSGLSPTLLETELFGYLKGAFTGADTDKPGKALLSLGGVLFLDEIGDMPLELQPRVMKFIEEKTFTPEGWFQVTEFYTPLLVVAATNKNIEDDVAHGRFRKDFYARFRHRINIPSIADRKDSLDAIIDFILQNPSVKGTREPIIRYVSKEALEKFKLLSYEENFRGLERVVKEAACKTRNFGLDIILPAVVESIS